MFYNENLLSFGKAEQISVNYSFFLIGHTILLLFCFRMAQKYIRNVNKKDKKIERDKFTLSNQIMYNV